MLRKYKSLYSSTTNTFSTGEAVTITPASVVGLPTDTEITLTFDRVDSSGTKTPSKMERIRGTVVGSNFVVSSGGRAVEGTEQTHTSPVVEMVWNADDWNDTVDHILTEHNQDGTHKDTLVTTLKATGAEINTGTEDAKIVTPKAIADSYLSNAYNSLARQAIINGNFDVWQRGTSFTGIANGAFSADRFTYFITGSANNASRSTFTLGQTDVPYSPRYYITNTVTSSAGASNRVMMAHKIEDVTRFSGKWTLSFWAKADASKNMAVEFSQGFGSGGSPSAGVFSIEVTTLALTTSWAKHTITVDVPSLSGKTLGTDNNSSFQIFFWFDAGADYNARTNSLGQQSGTFDIAQVQLCAGDVALPFMPKSYDEELRACLRYYQSFNVIVQAGAAGYTITRPAPLRAVVTATGGGAGYAETQVTLYALVPYQNTAGAQTLVWNAEL